MRFEIPVENIEALRKAAAKIQKKAAAYNCKATYEEVEEVFRKAKDENGNMVTRKYIAVEVEGEAKVDGWVFAGTIEHTEAGNILRSVSDEYKIPERYRNAEPNCEHCNTKRARKDTYVVFNEETQEFKQVGKSCLKDYTNGLSLEAAALVAKWVENVERYCSYNGGNFKKYLNVVEISKYFVETMRKFGWANSSAAVSTRELALDFFEADHPNKSTVKEFIEEMRAKADLVNFDPKHVTDEYIEAALNWAKGWDGHEYNDYRENLKVIANMEFCEHKHLGYLASLYMAYDRDMEREVKRMERNKSRAQSEHVGEIKSRMTFNIKEFKELTAWENEWGITFMYEFITEDGNILIWKTSKYIEEEEITSITGTVKAHSEFRGVKQTELTRCKIA